MAEFKSGNNQIDPIAAPVAPAQVRQADFTSLISAITPSQAELNRDRKEKADNKRNQGVSKALSFANNLIRESLPALENAATPNAWGQNLLYQITNELASGVDPDDWGKVLGAAKDQIGYMTKERVLVKGEVTEAIDGAGNVHTYQAAGSTKQDSAIESLAINLGEKNFAAWEAVHRDDTVDQRREAARKALSLSEDVRMSNAKLQSIRNKQDALDITGRVEAKEVENDIRLEWSDSFKKALDANMPTIGSSIKDPQVRFDLFKNTLTEVLLNNSFQERMIDADIPWQGFFKERLAEIDSLQELFLNASKVKANQDDIDLLKSEQELQVYKATSGLSTYDKFLLQNPNAPLALTIGKAISSNFSNDMSRAFSIIQYGNTKSEDLKFLKDSKAYNKILLEANNMMVKFMPDDSGKIPADTELVSADALLTYIRDIENNAAEYSGGEPFKYTDKNGDVKEYSTDEYVEILLNNFNNLRKINPGFNRALSLRKKFGKDEEEIKKLLKENNINTEG